MSYILSVEDSSTERIDSMRVCLCVCVGVFEYLDTSIIEWKNRSSCLSLSLFPFTFFPFFSSSSSHISLVVCYWHRRTEARQFHFAIDAIDVRAIVRGCCNLSLSSFRMGYDALWYEWRKIVLPFSPHCARMLCERHGGARCYPRKWDYYLFASITVSHSLPLSLLLFFFLRCSVRIEPEYR